MLLYRLCKLHANAAAWFGGSKSKRQKIRKRVLEKYSRDFLKNISDFQSFRVFESIQNNLFPLALEKTEKVIIVLVPEHDAMSGGIYSMFSIATHLRRIKSRHGYEVVIMTRPNETKTTYFRNSNFINSENVYRFEQILRMPKLKEVYLHIPEYATVDFVDNLEREELKFLLKLKKLDINILNQNIKLMPAEEEYSALRKIADNVTQSVAHHAYFSQEMADKYQVPTLLLPAYTDLTNYPKTGFEAKKKLIIYSLDEAPHKKQVLSKIKKQLPDFELIEIKDITFDTFMNYATECMFSISFGEGFDGYVAQPIYQGGLGITVYNDEFFPSDDFKKYPVFFDDEKDMIKNICKTITYYSTHPKEYEVLNKQLISEYDKLYSYNEYLQQIEKLANKEFEFFPSRKL